MGPALKSRGIVHLCIRSCLAISAFPHFGRFLQKSLFKVIYKCLVFHYIISFGFNSRAWFKGKQCIVKIALAHKSFAVWWSVAASSCADTIGAGKKKLIAEKFSYNKINQSIKCVNKPSLSFGSNQGAFGGIILYHCRLWVKVAQWLPDAGWMQLPFPSVYGFLVFWSLVRSSQESNYVYLFADLVLVIYSKHYFY